MYQNGGGVGSGGRVLLVSKRQESYLYEQDLFESIDASIRVHAHELNTFGRWCVVLGSFRAGQDRTLHAPPGPSWQVARHHAGADKPLGTGLILPWHPTLPHESALTAACGPWPRWTRAVQTTPKLSKTLLLEYTRLTLMHGKRGGVTATTQWVGCLTAKPRGHSDGIRATLDKAVRSRVIGKVAKTALKHAH